MNKTELGRLGEILAVEYLISHHYQVIDQNFHSIYGEIDIVAIKKNKIHFVEVKARKNISFGLPIDSYSQQKQQKIIKTAFIYIQEKKMGMTFQFDFVGILLDQDNQLKSLEMIENALYD